MGGAVAVGGLHEKVGVAAVAGGSGEFIGPDEAGEVGAAFAAGGEPLFVAGHVGRDHGCDGGGGIGRFGVQLGEPQTSADGDALGVDDRIEFVAVDAGEDAGDGQGRAGDAGLQGAAGGGAGVVGHLRENGPQLGQFACQVGGGAGQAQAGNGRQQVGFAGG